jgi:hypothetical protein
MGQYLFTLPGDAEPLSVILADSSAAWDEAVRVCGEMLRDMDGALPSNTDWHVKVTDGAGFPIATIRVLARRHA